MHAHNLGQHKQASGRYQHRDYYSSPRQTQAIKFGETQRRLQISVLGYISHFHLDLSYGSEQSARALLVIVPSYIHDTTAMLPGELNDRE